MSKLKTLKDLAEKTQDKYHGDCYSDELKQEAIKWIKEVKEDAIIDKDLIFYEGDEIVKWIKHFFNIKEEDLKEEK